MLTPWLPIYPCVLAIRNPFLCIFRPEKKIKIHLPWTNVIKYVLVSDYLNDCIDDILFYVTLKEKRHVTVIISWHWNLRGNFLVDTLRYLSWSDLSRSWHLAASGMGLGVISHQVGLLTALHHNYPASTSVLRSKEAIWRPPWVDGPRAKRPSASCPECICNHPRPWSRPCVSDWGCGAVILLSRGEFGREKNKICYQRVCVWTICYMPNL